MRIINGPMSGPHWCLISVTLVLNPPQLPLAFNNGVSSNQTICIIEYITESAIVLHDCVKKVI